MEIEYSYKLSGIIDILSNKILSFDDYKSQKDMIIFSLNQVLDFINNQLKNINSTNEIIPSNFNDNQKQKELNEDESIITYNNDQLNNINKNELETNEDNVNNNINNKNKSFVQNKNETKRIPTDFEKRTSEILNYNAIKPTLNYNYDDDIIHENKLRNKTENNVIIKNPIERNNNNNDNEEHNNNEDENFEIENNNNNINNTHVYSNNNININNDNILKNLNLKNDVIRKTPSLIEKDKFKYNTNNINNNFKQENLINGKEDTTQENININEEKEDFLIYSNNNIKFIL